MVKVYSYSSCSTCRHALSWLRGRSVEHTVIPVRDSPPPLSELMEMLAHYGERRNTVLNTSGRDYREMRLKDRVAKMTDQELAKLLSQHGNLIKRPFVYSRERKIVGFREADWEQLFG